MRPGGQPCPTVDIRGTCATLCRHASVPGRALWLKELFPDWSAKQPTTHLRSSLLLGAKRLLLPLSTGRVGDIFMHDNLGEPLVSTRPQRIHNNHSDTHRFPNKKHDMRERHPPSLNTVPCPHSLRDWVSRHVLDRKRRLSWSACVIHTHFSTDRSRGSMLLVPRSLSAPCNRRV